MNLVLIPTWLSDSLKANSKPLSDVTDLKNLSDILSQEDVAFYIFLNRHMERWFSKTEAALEVFERPVAVFEFTEETEELDKLASTFNLEYTNKPANSHELFGPLSEEVVSWGIDFKVVVVDQETLGLMPFVNPSLTDPTAKRVTPFKNVMDDLLFHLNSKMEFSELARTKLFKEFLETQKNS